MPPSLSTSTNNQPNNETPKPTSCTHNHRTGPNPNPSKPTHKRKMCTNITRLHRGCQHPTRGTAGPPTEIRSCQWARVAYCPEFQRDAARVVDSEACEYCDGCLMYGANLCRKNGMDPDVYVRTFGHSLAALMEFAPPGWKWSDFDR
jgi:hypothetical protein